MKKNARSQNRRQFLKGSAALALSAPMIIPASALGADGKLPPSERVAMGFIGVGGRGTGVMKHFITKPHCQAVAICDVKPERREEVKKIVEDYYDEELGKGAFKGCAVYDDFRELLQRKDIDAVSIATPDHWHVPIGMAAAQAGKDMYIEKPLTYTLAEGRRFCDVIKKYDRVFQHGTQQRSDFEFRLACELVRNGRIGNLHTMKVGAPGGSEFEDYPEMKVPPGFDYKMWLGPAPYRPYTENRVITPYWYFISDYSIGFISGWGVHHVDIAQWGNGTDHTGPLSVEGTGTFPKGGITDTELTWDSELHYANGVKMLFGDNQRYEQGVRFEGDEGWVHVNRSVIEAEPASLLKETFGPNDIRLYRSDRPDVEGHTDNHVWNFLDCVKSRYQTACPPEIAHRSMSICHLTKIAIALGRRLYWNPEKECFIGDDEANVMLDKPGRATWKL